MQWKRQRDGEKKNINTKNKTIKITFYFYYLHLAQLIASICFFFRNGVSRCTYTSVLVSTIQTFFIWQMKVQPMMWKIYEPCPICSLYTYPNKALYDWSKSHFSKCHASLLLVSAFFAQNFLFSENRILSTTISFRMGILKTTQWCYISIIWLTNWIHVLLDRIVVET